MIISTRCVILTPRSVSHSVARYLRGGTVWRDSEKLARFPFEFDVPIKRVYKWNSQPIASRTCENRQLVGKYACAGLICWPILTIRWVTAISTKVFFAWKFQLKPSGLACKLCLFLPKRPNANESINIAKTRLRVTAKFSRRGKEKRKKRPIGCREIWFNFFSWTTLERKRNRRRLVNRRKKENCWTGILPNFVGVVDWGSVRAAGSCFLSFPWSLNRGFSSEVCASKPQKIKHFW